MGFPKRSGVSLRAREFRNGGMKLTLLLVLTVTSEALQYCARWQDVDLEHRILTVPALDS